jgi:cyanosortase A-associated protein
MVASRWQPLRIVAIALTLGGVVGVLAKTILFPNAKSDRELGSFDFPATVPLPQWQLVSAKPLTSAKSAPDLGQQYQYSQNKKRVDIEARYERYTDGNIGRLLVVYTPIKPATVLPTVKYREDIGYYSLFEYKEKAYLSACLNPMGQSTVTEQQFVQNKYSYGWNPKRTLGWILGQDDLFDGRCLWTLLSTPVVSDSGSTAQEEAYQNLENVWFGWHRWWKSKLSD